MCFSKKVQAKKNSQNWCSQQIAAELGVFFLVQKEVWVLARSPAPGKQ